MGCRTSKSGYTHCIKIFLFIRGSLRSRVGLDSGLLTLRPREFRLRNLMAKTIMESFGAR